MRCLTLAAALRQAGAACTFFCRSQSGDLREMIASQGHEIRMLTPLPGAVTDAADEKVAGIDGPPHAGWLRTSSLRDAQDTLDAMAGQCWDWLVVDHYGLDAEWENAMRVQVKKILCIDDLADRNHDCDLLLDQNLYDAMDSRYIGKVPAHCSLLLGPHYALLREEFRRARAQVTPRTGPVKRVLVFFGGVDAGNYTTMAIEALAKLDIEGLHVDVVIGTQHPCHKNIESLCLIHRFVLHVQTNRMAELMAGADLGVGAAGSAIWERCCMGLPSVVIAVAKNQVRAATALASSGVAEYVGVAQEISSEKLIEVIQRTIESASIERVSKLGIELVDAAGVFHIVNAMKSISGDWNC